ncbi:Hypothetical protein PHPALM_8916 [Phytophthora palmivora]|uniref:Uncharacterized protein n=1 Tax=Phytophthora palmivora TaxID=4796 RepID=A0A2P4Y8P4_9STRA|nr:Hypothetical protein PHPALM_8916 [Phytophthora palmivora]
MAALYVCASRNASIVTRCLQYPHGCDSPTWIEQKKMHINTERGTFTFAESTKVADLKMLHW